MMASNLEPESTLDLLCDARDREGREQEWEQTDLPTPVQTIVEVKKTASNTTFYRKRIGRGNRVAIELFPAGGGDRVKGGRKSGICCVTTATGSLKRYRNIITFGLSRNTGKKKWMTDLGMR